MSPQQTSLGGPLVVVGHQDAPLPGGHGLDRVEGESGDVCPRVATQLPLFAIGPKSSADAVTSIFDNKGPMCPRDTRDLRHVARHTGIIDRDHRFGVFLPSFLQARGIKVMKDGINVAKIWSRADVSRRIGRGEKGVRTCDNTIPGPDTQNLHREM